jgi:hypothetical protein
MVIRMLEIEKDVEITEMVAPFAPIEQLGVYHIRRWTWYEKQSAIVRATQILDEKTGLVYMPIEDYYAQMMVMTVRSAPEGITWNIEFIKGKLDADIGDVLRDACRDINGLIDKEKKTFLPPSEPDEIIPG